MTLGPTPPRERLEGLDVLRGAALAGVLLENLQHFVVPSYAAWVSGPEAGGLDRAALWLIRFACDNKVYALFSFLFGTGIALQMERAASRGERFVPLHVWRMAVLFLIGAAHSLVWSGDILTTYALLGLLLLPLRHAGARALLGVAGAALLAPATALALLDVAAGAPPARRPELASLAAEYAYPIRQACFAFAMFAIGLLAGRDERLRDPAALAARTRRWLAPAAAIGVAANLAYATLLGRAGAGSLDGRGILLELTAACGAPSLAFVALWLVFRGLGHARWRARLLPLAAVGRTSLSNYLLQTGIGVGILARTGLGPLGPVTPPVGLVLSVALFALQVLASRWWLAHFRFGPVEWLWRGATYGFLEPLRVARAGGP